MAPQYTPCIIRFCATLCFTGKRSMELLARILKAQKKRRRISQTSFAVKPTGISLRGKRLNTHTHPRKRRSLRPRFRCALGKIVAQTFDNCVRGGGTRPDCKVHHIAQHALPVSRAHWSITPEQLGSSLHSARRAQESQRHWSSPGGRASRHWPDFKKGKPEGRSQLRRCFRKNKRTHLRQPSQKGYEGRLRAYGRWAGLVARAFLLFFFAP